MIGPFRRTRRPKPPENPISRPRAAAERRPAIPCAPARTDGTFRRAIETGRARLIITGAVMAFAFVAVSGRLVDLGAFPAGDSQRAPSYAAAPGPKETERALITDRNGVILATSMTTTALAVRPDRVLDAEESARKLARVFPKIGYDALLERLTADTPFTYIHRRLTPRMEAAVMQLGIPGLEFERDETRVYPHGELASHILGYTDVDGNGLSGIERGLEDRLRESGEPLRLSIDLRFQHVAHRELSEAIETYDAIGGAAIVMDVQSAEVLAMVSMPDFDPNRPADTPRETRFNRATFGTYELGSTFKIFNTAIALETGTAGMADGYDATDPIRISRFTIRDFHGEGRYLTLPEIFIYSSNIGSAKMAMDIGAERQQAFMRQLGMLDALPLEIPEAGSPLYPDRWREISAMTISYGHGLAVTPLHLVSGVAAMINGGVVRQPTLLARDTLPRGERIISEHTSFDIRRLMRLNAVEGSGKRALVPGFMVGGKTGTADKPNGSGYHDRARISSFVGAFPMTNPRYAVYVVLDEPQGTEETFGFATGGWVAAPAVGDIIAGIGAIAGVIPVEEDAPEIQHAFAIELPEEQPTLVSLQQ
jgi:cell division protein FtsI (penicillin-binding protein 3)